MSMVASAVKKTNEAVNVQRQPSFVRIWKADCPTLEARWNPDADSEL